MGIYLCFCSSIYILLLCFGIVYPSFFLSQISDVIREFHNYISVERWQDSIILMIFTHVAVVAIILIRQVTQALDSLLEFEETIARTQQRYLH